MDESSDVRVQRLTTPKQCLIFARNAHDRDRDDLARQCRHRWVELTAAEHLGTGEEEEPVDRELWQALAASEFVLGRNATGTRLAIRRRGLVRAAEQVVCKGELSTMFTELDEAGLLEYAWEHVVLRNPDAFSEQARESAQARLEAYELHKDAVEVA